MHEMKPSSAFRSQASSPPSADRARTETLTPAGFSTGVRDRGGGVGSSGNHLGRYISIWVQIRWVWGKRVAAKKSACQNRRTCTLLDS